MYLSRVEIDIKNRKKIRNLTHLGAYHDWVERSFPEEIKASYRSRKLWRIDKLDGKLYLLILSECRPDHGCLERYGVESTAETKLYDSLLNSLENDQSYRFKATLNPIISRSEGMEKRGRVVPLLSLDAQMGFLHERAKKNGFKVEPDEFYITKRGFEKLKKSNSSNASINKVTYEGKLTVTDVDLFREALKGGIGRKKAYGCGLITIVPGE